MRLPTPHPSACRLRGPVPRRPQSHLRAAQLIRLARTPARRQELLDGQTCIRPDGYLWGYGSWSTRAPQRIRPALAVPDPL
jgi:hypothetical protein